MVGIWGVGGYGGSGGALPRAVPRGDGWHQHPGGGWTDRSPLTSSPTGRDAAPAAPGRGSGRRRDRVRVRVRDARAASGSRPWTAPSWRVTARGQRAKVTGGGEESESGELSADWLEGWRQRDGAAGHVTPGGSRPWGPSGREAGPGPGRAPPPPVPVTGVIGWGAGTPPELGPPREVPPLQRCFKAHGAAPEEPGRVAALSRVARPLPGPLTSQRRLVVTR